MLFFCCLRHNGLEQYTSTFTKTIRADATFNFACVHGSITNLEICTRQLRSFKSDDYQNGLADILCKATHLFCSYCSRTYSMYRYIIIESKFWKHYLTHLNMMGCWYMLTTRLSPCTQAVSWWRHRWIHSRCHTTLSPRYRTQRQCCLLMCDSWQKFPHTWQLN